MPTQPTDPTKAQVWKTGTPENPKFEFYIPRGAKGEPGGWNQAIDIGTIASLNDIKSTGIYRLSSTQNGLLARGFPKEQDSGVLTVYERVPGGSTVFQEWRSMLFQYKMLYVRTWDGGAGLWTAWKCIPSQRVDTTAGRAIYTWDDVNGREQLTYGDTGLRSLTLDNGYSGSLYIRRFGANVNVTGTITRPPGVSLNGIWLSSIPAGFRPHNTAWVYFPIRHNGSNAFFSIYRKSTELSFTDATGDSDSTQVRFDISWQTNDVWPATLPGVAFGTIPNL